MSQGLFITFEGIDGAGKSTHIAALAQALRDQGHTVTLTREPGGTPLSEQLRELVLHQAMDPLTEALLMFAARREHIVQVIAPALARGEAVLCDRFTDASFAYQGFGRGFDLGTLQTLERWVQQQDDGRLLQPDLTLWFDLPAETAAARLSGARAPDRFEALPLDFFRRVSAGYAARLQAHPDRIERLAADQPPEGVWQAVLVACRRRPWWKAGA